MLVVYIFLTCQTEMDDWNHILFIHLCVPPRLVLLIIWCMIIELKSLLPHISTSQCTIAGLWAKSSLLLIFINKVLLKNSHAPYLVYGCFCAIVAELSSWDYSKMKIFTTGPFIKSLQTLILEDYYAPILI